MQFVVIITMAALLITVGYRYFTPQRDLQFTENFQKAAEAAYTALAVNLVKSGGVLPCPAIDPVNNPGRGPANCTSPTWGTLPYVDLGLKATDAQDEWGSLLTYAVSGPAVGTPGRPSICFGGDLASLSATPPNPPLLSGPSDTPYILMSHGPNRSFSAGGAQAGTTGSQTEEANCARDAGVTCGGGFNPAQFSVGPFNTEGANLSPPPNAYFDDIVSVPDLTEFRCVCSDADIEGVTGTGVSGFAVTGLTASAAVSVPTGGTEVEVVVGVSNPGADCSLTMITRYRDPQDAASAVTPDTVAEDTDLLQTLDLGQGDRVTYQFTIPHVANGTNRTITVLAKTEGQEARSPGGWLTLTLNITYETTQNPDPEPEPGNPGAGCYMANGKPNGRPKAQECPPPPGHDASGNWVNNDNRTVTMYSSGNLHAYWDFYERLGASGGGNRDDVVTTKGKNNAQVRRNYTMDYNLSLGSPCYVSTPNDTGPFINSGEMRFQNNVSVPLNSDAGRIYFMGSRQGGGGCRSISTPLTLGFSGMQNGEVLRRLFLALAFDPHFAGTITQPQAVGIVFRLNDRIVGTVYRCYANNWFTTGGVLGAQEIFPPFINQWGQAYNWCNGQIAASQPTTPTVNPQFMEIYLYNRANGSTAAGPWFDEIEIFPVGNSRFWFGGVGLGVN
ncbi:hypothetical protein [Caenispirillum bisanense]|uniref:hypothetical protein n=1 Tax=Caenispirillum bisanense TaxID=414052 RepID=UPI0031D328F5